MELEDGPALADIEASSARVCALSEHIIGKLDFGAEPSGYLRLLDESGHGGDDHD
ncbi:MAG: hypothetical protein MI741_21945 [Rhodospirillales bacterium]|nr:hypothetical protein [Rhodospirillales bacterium]